MGVRIQPVDVYDEAALRSWHRTLAEGESYGRDHPTVWQLPEVVVELRRANTSADHELFVAVVDGRVAGAASLEIPLLDNPHLVALAVAVPPPDRGRGVGSALVEHAVARTRAVGRRSLVAEVNAPLGAGTDHPYRRFAAEHGFTHRLMALHQVLDLPVPFDRLDQLAADAAARHRDYRLVSWGDHCPPEHVASYCAMLSAMGEQAPMGDLDVEPERWDARRLREAEERRVAQGRTRHTTVAVAPDGSLAGYTELAVPAHDPGQVYQWDTLVLPDHRGHRLGLALKVANLRRMQEAHADRRLAHTWNAQSNSPMLAVNEVLGFRPVEQMEEWQRDL